MATVVILPRKWVQILIAEPETGMGWQMVEFKLEDGTVVQYPVVNCEAVQVPDGVKFYAMDIKDLKVIPKG